MDGIEKITGRIAADGQKEADAILEKYDLRTWE